MVRPLQGKLLVVHAGKVDDDDWRVADDVNNRDKKDLLDDLQIFPAHELTCCITLIGTSVHDDNTEGDNDLCCDRNEGVCDGPDDIASSL
ncbi:hypothetical protein Bpfe_017264 [Biomphalaria pfeifferi]|uniref:Uncharacterized protein n=1 Tax=Biomphalaria pfeifferi TaxID=112525 RepID=A0AAD8BG27_BIOPF|nr:hypothetical protein Bpfe_017264 [Biomphalaria pfeifferi]